MRKYPAGERIVGAIYDNAPADNPLLAALPEMLSQDVSNQKLSGNRS